VWIPFVASERERWHAICVVRPFPRRRCKARGAGGCCASSLLLYAPRDNRLNCREIKHSSVDGIIQLQCGFFSEENAMRFFTHQLAIPRFWSLNLTGAFLSHITSTVLTC
jgi:hypothetical protein